VTSDHVLHVDHAGLTHSLLNRVRHHHLKVETKKNHFCSFTLRKNANKKSVAIILTDICGEYDSLKLPFYEDGNLGC
jgi:hypothetical protein